MVWEVGKRSLFEVCVHSKFYLSFKCTRNVLTHTYSDDCVCGFFFVSFRTLFIKYCIVSRASSWKGSFQRNKFTAVDDNDGYHESLIKLTRLYILQWNYVKKEVWYLSNVRSILLWFHSKERQCRVQQLTIWYYSFRFLFSYSKNHILSREHIEEVRLHMFINNSSITMGMVQKNVPSHRCCLAIFQFVFFSHTKATCQYVISWKTVSRCYNKALYTL